MMNEELRQFRQSKGWNQQQMASELGVSQARISDWEKKKRPIPPYIEKFIECLKKNKGDE